MNMVIGDKTISPHSMPYIIAEVGVNHEGSLSKAKELIDLAHEGGVDAVKFQTYKAERLASKTSPAYWDLGEEPTTSQYELFKKYDSFDAKEYELLAEHCQKVGIHFLSTPFDDEAVGFLAPLVPCMKIASADITNVPLLRKVAATGKPVLLSTGASTLAEIDMAVAELEAAGCASLALLHCVLNYPTPYGHAHLNMINGLARAFPHYLIGYSDHTEEPLTAPAAAVALGARVIEKHFTLSKRLPGPDHAFALEPDQLRNMISAIRETEKTLKGYSDKKIIQPCERELYYYKRCLYYKRNLPKNHVLSRSDIQVLRNNGVVFSSVNPLEVNKAVGKMLRRPKKENDIVVKEDLR